MRHELFRSDSSHPKIDTLKFSRARTLSRLRTGDAGKRFRNRLDILRCSAALLLLFSTSLWAQRVPCFDTFAVDRNYSQGENGIDVSTDPKHLHPVIRHFRGGEQISEHHILEDLHGEWKNEKLHIEPLLAYFRLEKEATARVAAASV